MSEILAVLRRRRHLAMFVVAIGLAATVTLVIALPNVYKMKTTLLVDHGEVSGELVKMNSPKELDLEVKSITQDVMSRGHLLQLVDQFDLAPAGLSTAKREAFVEKMRREIGFELEEGQPGYNRDSTVSFSLSYQGTDPQKVAGVVNALADLYVARNAENQQRLAAGTSEALAAELAAAERQLAAQEQKFLDFKRQHMGELPDQVATQLRTLERLSSQLQSNRERRIEVGRDSERRSATVGGALADTSLDPLEATLAQKRNEMRDLRSKYSERYPDVVSLQRQITELESQVERAPKPKATSKAAEPDPQAAAGSERQRRVSEEVQSLDAEERQLNQAIERYQNRVDAAPRYGIEMDALTRDYEATKEQYHSLLRRADELRLAGRLEQQLAQGQFRVLDPALVSSPPTGPDRLKLFLGGLLLTVTLAAGVLVLAEQHDTSFHSLQALRSFTRVPVLATIPRIESRKGRVGRFSRTSTRLLVEGAAVALVIGLSQHLVRGNEALALLLSGGAR
jgi:polysaccharide chain length determinant protein (PEP-CTERM system associated)